MGRYEVKFRYNSDSKTSRNGVNSTLVTATSSVEARNQVKATRSMGNGITIISVVKKS